MNTTPKKITKKDLEILKLRAGIMPAGVSERLSTFLDTAIAQYDDEEALQTRTDLIRRAFKEGNIDAMQELNAMRVVTINNFITAMSNTSAFFEGIELKANEVPFYENKTGYETKIRHLGEDGAPFHVQVVKSQSQANLTLRWLGSEVIEIPIIDINKGDVYDQTSALFDSAYDLAMKKDALRWGLIDAACGAFVVTGKVEKRTFHLHSSIKAANLPQANLITDVKNNNATSKFRFDVVRAGVQWCSYFGNNTFSTGPVYPVAFYVASSQVGDMLDEIEISSTNNAFVEEIKGFGHVITLGGRKITIIGDATIDPDDNACYMRTNMPLGQEFTKPSLDQSFPGSPQEITRQEREQNKVGLSHRTVHAACVPEAQRLGVVKLVFQS